MERLLKSVESAPAAGEEKDKDQVPLAWTSAGGTFNRVAWSAGRPADQHTQRSPLPGRANLNLHKAAQRAHALDPDLRAGVRVDHASPGVTGVPVLDIVVKDGRRRLAGVIRRLAKPVQRDPLSARGGLSNPPLYRRIWQSGGSTIGQLAPGLKCTPPKGQAVGLIILADSLTEQSFSTGQDCTTCSSGCQLCYPVGSNPQYRGEVTM
jgi:hypothetical protein